MKFIDFVKECQRRQRAYITAEQRRIAKAERAYRRYEMNMSALGLHPLTRNEIQDRSRELSQMRESVPETHGDSPWMRSAWETRFGAPA